MPIRDAPGTHDDEGRPPLSVRDRITIEPLRRSILAGVIDPEPSPDEADLDADPEAQAAALPRTLDVAIVPLFSDERPLTGLGAFLDWRASGAVSALLREQWCDGGAGEAVLMPAQRTMPMERIVLFGLGPSQGFDAERARKAARAMVDVALRLSPRDVMFAMPGKGQERAIVEAMLDGAVAALTDASQAAELARAQGAAEGESKASSDGADGVEPTRLATGVESVDVEADTWADAETTVDAQAGEAVDAPNPGRATGDRSRPASETNAPETPEPETIELANDDRSEDAPQTNTSAAGDPETVTEQPGADAVDLDAATTGHAEPQPGAAADAVAPDTDEPRTGQAVPESDAAAQRGARCHWWVIADPRHVARLRRVLEGPPRPAGGGG